MSGKSSIRLNNLYFICIVLSPVLLSACTYDGVKRTAYESIYQRNCMDRVGVPDCDSEHKSYDRYKYEREKSLEGR